ncbi:MAG: molecular chaperone HtpG [Alphaproteobacteria bacterium]|nr:molecular chaperone HtpG [Alphaproteobacteria bacterium]
MTATTAPQSFVFEAEVARLLKLMVNSVYSEPEVFLRELVSNASDACDKLRYRAIAEPALAPPAGLYQVDLVPDPAARTLTVADNGIGMSREELIRELGTIARSGTGGFAEQLTGDDAKDLRLIGQFGVGFYSAFIPADRVEVVSRMAGAGEAWRWSSTGDGRFEVAPAERATAGTSITLHLKPQEDRWLEAGTLARVVKKYSDHIAIPIVLVEGDKRTALNEASALWTRPRKDITAEQYREFFRHVAHAQGEPWLTLHARAEGKVEYTLLLFVPERRPLDLFDPARRHGVKLYVRRVFITDACEGLVPPYLRFLSGVVDAEDLPLNLSREVLQNNPLVQNIRANATKRVLTELRSKADKEPEAYAAFWRNFGAVLKEGIYEDTGHRADLLGLLRCRTTAGEGFVSLKDYVGRMKEQQKAIYYILGDDAEALAKSPQLEGFRARGLEVLLLADAVDDFWLMAAPEFDGKLFQSVTRGAADLTGLPLAEAPTATPGEPPREADVATLLALFRQSLGDKVKDVRRSERLTDSAVCLVADAEGLDLHLERMLKAHKRLEQGSKPVLEINAAHPLIRALVKQATQKGAASELADTCQLLFEQACIQEGEPLADVAGFAKRLQSALQRGLGG